MPKPYSLDLRERAIAACEAGDRTRAEVALQFQLSESTLYEWLQRHRKGQSIAALPHAGGTASALDEQLLRDLVEASNDATLEEYAQAYAAHTGRRYSISKLSRALKELKLSRKERRYAPRSTSSRRSRPSA
jgi:transposase